MKSDKPKIGVLALQGDFEAHQRALEAAGAIVCPVRRQSELADVDGLVLPGGESTTMLNLLHEEKLFEPLQRFGQEKPIFGTCAGAILVARKVLRPEQESLNLMDLEVERNAYGRQVDSRIVKLELEGKPTEAVFIRAPIIREAGPEVTVLAEYQDTPVLVEQGRHMASTFHPELTQDYSVHQRFVDKVRQFKEQQPALAETSSSRVS
jgi:pyridoxal 5'-phosphate synthase pdxT subunit